MPNTLPEPRYDEYTKCYPGAPKVALPPAARSGMPLEEVLARRRSVRKLANRPLTGEQLSALCFAAYGVTGELPGRTIRTIPSAGALYPLELYLAVNSVEGIAQGIYHYLAKEHSLELMREGDVREAAYHPCRQKWAKEAAVVFAMGAVWDRTKRKYGEKSIPYFHTETGHMGQNLYLEATALGLGTVVIGAFRNSGWADLLGLNPEVETVIYLQIAGPLG